MDIQEILSNAEGVSIEEVQSAISTLKQRDQEQTTLLRVAIDAYFATVAEKESAVSERMASLGGQLRDIDAQIEAFRPALVKATVEGNDGQISSVQSDMTALEIKRASVAKQVEMLNTSLFPGSAEEFGVAQAQYEAFLSASEQIHSELALIQEFARDQVMRWQEIAKDEVRSDPFLTRKYEKMSQDYSSGETIFERLKRRGREAQEAAKRAAARARQDARLAKLDRRAEEAEQRRAAYKPEYKTDMGPDGLVRYKLNHTTGEYEVIHRQSTSLC